MTSALHWLNSHPLLGVPLPHWLYAIGIAVLAYLAAHAALRILARRLHALDARRPGTTSVGIISAVLGKTRTRLLLLLFLLIAIYTLGLGKTAELWLYRAAIAVGGLQIGLWLSAALKVWTHERVTSESERRLNPIILSMVSWFVLIMIWAIVLLAVLANMGMNVTAFVASLGVGGIAVALALQNVLKDLFASLAIGFDEPFEIGDFITFGDVTGTVVRVGVKTTRIRTLRGEELAIGNANLLEKTIHNMSRIATRRIVFDFSISIETPQAKVQQVIDTVHEIMQAVDGVTFDRGNFTAFGNSSMDFQVVYTSQDPGYAHCLDIQQDINLTLMKRLDAMNVRLAIPVNVQYSAPHHPVGETPATTAQQKVSG